MNRTLDDVDAHKWVPGPVPVRVHTSLSCIQEAFCEGVQTMPSCSHIAISCAPPACMHACAGSASWVCCTQLAQ